MSYNRELEIEKALNSGEEILRQRPELYEMDCETLLDELDDGTREMIHNRWGVAAWIAVKKLQSFSIENLVKELPVSYGNKFELSREYTGYLLQWKYQVRLDLLLLEAQRQGIVDQIESFAASNLEYGQQLAVENVSEMLELLEQRNGILRLYMVMRNWWNIWNSSILQPVSLENCQIRQNVNLYGA